MVLDQLQLVKFYIVWPVDYAVRPYLPDTFLPYGQVGVGVRSGLKATVHGICKLNMDNSQNAEL